MKNDESAGIVSRALTGLTSDIRFAVRMLLKNRSFAASALITLALCIGANTAIFSMLYALVIKPLPFPESERIVEVYNSFPKAGLNNAPSNVTQYVDFKENAPAFSSIGLWELGESTLGEESGPSRATGARATAEIFDVVGVKPLIGRFFTAENHAVQADKVVVITQSYWETRYQEDPGVLGRTMQLDGEAYEIIGVTPHNFEAFDARAKFVRPLSWPPDRVGPNFRYGLSPRLYGRLAPGATIGTALGQVTSLEQAFYDAADPQAREFLERSGHVMGVDTVQAQRVGPVKASLFLLQGGVLFVLLIGCVNVANLVLARSNARQGELAIRAALGAGRGTIARQLLVESVVLTWLGAVLGLGLAWAALGATNHFTSQLLPNALPFSIDGRVLGYTALIAVVMSLAIGLLPIAHTIGGSLLGSMQIQSRGTSTNRGVRFVSSALVVTQMAVALMLLSGAGLLVHSFARVLAVDPGFDEHQLVTARVALPAAYRGKAPLQQQFVERLSASLAEVPGASVTMATATPFQGGMAINTFVLRNYSLPPDAAQPGAYHLGASPSYLETMKIPLREGRWFAESDTDDAPDVIVVDQTFADRYFPNQSAVGQHFDFGGAPEKDSDWPTIVGVVGNVRHLGVEEESGSPFVYYPLKQTQFRGVSMLVRSPRPTAEVLAVVRDKVAAIDPSLPVFQESSMEDVIDKSYNNRRGTMLLLGCFAGLALLLSAVGIYGVLAYDVSQRTREIGIRGAVGATRWQVVAMILKQGFWKTGLGLVIGLGGALALSRFMEGLLYDVQPTDPIAYVAVSALLLVVGALASYLPARRASRIDPLVALRTE